MRRRPTLTLAILRSSSHRRIAACVTFSRSAACPTVSKLHSELPIPNLPFAPFVCANWRVWRRIATCQEEKLRNEICPCGQKSELGFVRCFFAHALEHLPHGFRRDRLEVSVIVPTIRVPTVQFVGDFCL
jgi:hypothetical protein